MFALIVFAVDSRAIDENQEIPQEIMSALKELGLFGQIVPKEYGEKNHDFGGVKP